MLRKKTEPEREGGKWKLVLTLVSVVVGIVELDADADVACVVIRFPRNP